MSRRHHGRSRHAERPRPDASGPAQGQVTSAPPAPVDPSGSRHVPAAAEVAAPGPDAVIARPAPPTPSPTNPVEPGPQAARPTNGGMTVASGCTAPQLRRFIKSRPYVPMHELRRRFGINGGDDDVTQVRMDDSAIYVGLPQREGVLLGELLRGGEIGFELSLDPSTPIVVGVYPMRPVPRG